MASRSYDQFQQTLVRGLVSAFIDVQFNNTSQPTVVQAAFTTGSANITFATASTKGSRWGGLTFVRNSQGDYTLTFVDKFVRILAYSATFLASGNAAAPITQIKVASNPNAAGSTTGMGFTGASLSPSLNAVELLFFSAQGSLADPAATEMAILSFQLLNSTGN